MYEKKVGRAYGRGCLMGLAVFVVGLVVGVALVGSVLWLIDGGRVAPRSPRFTLALLAPSILIAFILALAAIWVRFRGRRLDRAFASLGWKGQQAGPVLRSWHGVLDGREFDVWFHRGPTLEIYAGCEPGTRGIVHTGGPLMRAIGEALDKHGPLRPPPFDLEGATFYSHDEGWMRRLLERGRGENALRALMTDTHRSASNLLVGPNYLRYMRRFLPLREIKEENIRGWLTEVGTLAEEVDRLGPSKDAVEPKKVEEWARKHRGRHLKKIFFGLGIVLVLSMGGLFVFGWFFVGQ